jgi:hypothetical protein
VSDPNWVHVHYYANAVTIRYLKTNQSVVQALTQGQWVTVTAQQPTQPQQPSQPQQPAQPQPAPGGSSGNRVFDVAERRQAEIVADLTRDTEAALTAADKAAMPDKSVSVGHINNRAWLRRVSPDLAGLWDNWDATQQRLVNWLLDR